MIVSKMVYIFDEKNFTKASNYVLNILCTVSSTNHLISKNTVRNYITVLSINKNDDNDYSLNKGFLNLHATEKLNLKL